MKNKIIGVIDFEKVNGLLEGFYKTTGFVTAIMDLDGNVLSQSGWQQICIEFHRKNPDTAQNCRTSDTVLAAKMALGEKYHFYKCLNGLVDVAIPIIVQDIHIANLFTGQFFFEKPDTSYFERQAEKYGFDKAKYLEALGDVPVVSREDVKTAMEFLLKVTEIIAEMSLGRVEQDDLNQALEESEEKYRLLHEAAGVGIGYYSPEGIVISFNRKAAENMGGKPEDFAGKSIFDLFPKETADFYFNRIEKATRTESPQEYEDKVDLPIGVHWFSSIYTRITDSNQNILGIQIISTDITGKKLAEEEQKNLTDRFNRIASNVPGAIYEFCQKPDGTSFIPYASEGFNTLFELSPDDVKTDASPLYERIHPDDREDFFYSISESAEKLIPWHGENRIVLPSGKTIWVEGKSTPQKLEDGTIIWQGYLNNVTERKNAEKMLHESEEKYRQLYESNQMPISIFDSETLKFLSVNNAFIEKYGYTKEEFLKMTVLDIRPESEIERLKTSVKTTDNGLVNAGVYLHKKKNGQIIHVEIIRYDLVYEGKNAKLVFANDITNRIQTEEELRISEAKFKAVAEVSPLAIYSSSGSDQKAEFINPTFHNMFGYTREDVPTVGHWWIKAFPDENYRKHVMTDWQNEIDLANKNNTDVKPYECVCTCKDGSEKIVAWSAKNIGDEFWAFGQDLTERVNAEEAIKLSEEKFSSAFYTSPVGLTITRIADGKFLEVNESFCNIYEFTREEVIGRTSLDINILSPESRAKLIKAQLEQGGLRNFETLTYSKSGKPVNLFFSSKPITIEGEACYVTTMIDITDRIQTELELKKSEERFSKIFHASPYPINIFSFTNGRSVDVNDAFLKLVGYEREEFIGHTSTELNLFVNPGDRDVWMNEIRGFGSTHPHEIKIRKKSGELRDILGTIELIEVGEEKFGLSMAFDITERKLVEAGLKESEERLRLSTELANVAVWEFDFSTNNMTRSANHDGLYGLEPQEAWHFETFLNATHPDDREYSNAMIQASAAPGGPDKYKFDFRVVYPDQSIHWLMVTGQVIERNPNGEALVVRGTLIDITDRKLAEKELDESKFFFEQLFIQSSTSTQLLDSEGWCVKINPKLSSLFGVKPEDIEGKKYNILQDGEIIRTGVIDHLKRVFEKQETVRWEVNFDIQHASETTGVKVSKPEKRWFQNIAYPIVNEEGRLIYVIIQHDDITERMNAESKIKESETNLKSLINTTQDSIWSIDTDYRYIIFNKAYADVFRNQYGFELVKGMDAKKFLLPEQLEFWQSMYEPVFNGEKKVFEFNHNINGELRYFQTSINPIYEDKVIAGASAISVDITDIKKAEAEIIKLNEELEERVQVRTTELSKSQSALMNLVEDLNEKSHELDANARLLEAKNKELETFTYSVSHDLKAPLRGIDGYSRLLEEYYSAQLNSEARQFIKTIREGTSQMNLLIEDLLAYSRLERSTLRPSSINSNEFISGILKFFQNDIVKNKVTVEKDILECQLKVDPDGLTIIMRNIIENAIKFSSQGNAPKIKICIKENLSSWMLSVEDNGIGFDMKYQKRIFEIFQRLNLPEQYSGTGIGLAMVSKSVERMGGKVWAESELGKGATFYIQLSKSKL